MSTLAVYTVTHNCERIKYPFRACIESALALADAVYWCDACSTDGTWEAAQEWASREPKLRIMQHVWGDHYTILPRICNGILEGILQNQDFAMQLQADEVACEWTFDATRKMLDELPPGILLARPFYEHFCPDFNTTWPFIYQRKAVVSRTSSGIRWSMAGDACSLAGHPTVDLPLRVHHYGKVQIGRERAALLKELTFQEMYRDLGFPDPRVTAQRDSEGLDYMKVFNPDDFKPYTGRHPRFAEQWIAELERS